ncbi:OOP family OmpA-OmpF porin [Kluyvera sp. 1366]
MNTKQQAMTLMLLVTAALSAFSSRAAVDSRAFGEKWHSQGSPGSEQAQVIYYRTTAVSGADAAMVYLDGEFQAALLPGMYTRFCVTPGEHSLGAYQNDAPDYQGKSDQAFRAAFKGGKTYYVRVDSQHNGRPQAVRSAEANEELKTLRLQKHALSRASSVVACAYNASPVVDYTFSSDVLFNFARAGEADVKPAGRQAITALVGKLKRAQQTQNRIEIIGYTDPIGSDSSNQQLGQQRADTVRQQLINQGISAANITARSMGSSQPLVLCKRGSQQEKIACNAPNRRVIIRVEAPR